MELKLEIREKPPVFGGVGLVEQAEWEAARKNRSQPSCPPAKWFFSYSWLLSLPITKSVKSVKQVQVVQRK
jgi:hypothetical protein